MRLPLIAALALLATPAYAQAPAAGHAGHGAHGTVTHFQAPLRGGSEVPANASTGSGVADVWYDTATKSLSWKVTYTGLTGPVTAGHIHGPAPAGANAGVMIPFAVTASPIEGSAALTDAQAAALPAGQLYVNLHTAANPGGEIRGQLAPH